MRASQRSGECKGLAQAAEYLLAAGCESSVQGRAAESDDGEVKVVEGMIVLVAVPLTSMADSLLIILRRVESFS